MKKILSFIVLAILLISSCKKDNYSPDNNNPIPSDIPSARIEGRVASAYVTYYGTAIPDPKYLTHINYAFAELYMDNNQYQGFKLQGNENRFRDIVALKKIYPHLKILISFIHVVSNPDNFQGGGFSALAKSDASRKAFANDCKDFLIKWGIDGVDMDWEFPGLSWSGNPCDPAVDGLIYTLLMKQLRETLGSDFLLTYAGYVKDKQPTTGGYKFIDISAVNPYVDFVNIMTYNLDEAQNITPLCVIPAHIGTVNVLLMHIFRQEFRQVNWFWEYHFMDCTLFLHLLTRSITAAL